MRAKPTGKELFSGTYGRVIELSLAGEIVAGRVLKTSSNIDLQTLAHKLFWELTVMSQVHHPNIAQCKGVCFLENETMPVLLMERVMNSLHVYLLKRPNFKVTLVKKLSVLCDVASGLAYLHSHNPAIIHGDLTGHIILLDSELRAKISDFRNARQMDLDPDASLKMFSSPGTPDYMPPEVQGDSAKYDPSLDVFSFGHLSLFTIIQHPVCQLLPPTHPDGTTRSEVKRREQHLGKAEQLLGQEHSLIKLVKKCLHNQTALRPQTSELVPRLRDIQSTEAKGRISSSVPGKFQHNH